MMRRRPLAAAVILGLLLICLASVLLRPLKCEGSVSIARSKVSIRPFIGLISRQAGTVQLFTVRIGARLGLWISGRSIQPGWYDFRPDMTALDAITMIVLGRREPLIKVTIPEGYTIDRIARRLSARANIDSAAFVAWCSADSVRRRYGVQAPSMEGFLMPDTYFVLRCDDVDYVGEMMASHARRVWSTLPGLDSSADWNDRLRLATLASIVQLEAAVNDEMPTIAGVYANRLRIGMLLQADPTVQYLTGRDRITGVELRDASNRYNTYVHEGLPPGPIGNPGRLALEAACRPQSHDLLFFVARGDSSRRHRFARTLAEHNANVRLYRQARRSAADVSLN